MKNAELEKKNQEKCLVVKGSEQVSFYVKSIRCFEWMSRNVLKFCIHIQTE